MRGARRAAAALFPVAAVVAALLLAVPARADEALRWGGVEVRCSSPADSIAFLEALDLEGRPVAGAPLDAAIRRGLDALAERGHPFAEARPGGFALDNGRLTGRIRLDAGVAARLDGLVLPGAEVTSVSTALRLAGITRGELYTGDADRRVRDRLARSGLFTSVGEPVLEPGLAPDAVLLKLPVTEPPYTRFSGILGVSGRNSKLTGLVDLDLANIGGTARHAAGRWESRGNGLTRYNLSYREPWLPLIPVGVEGALAHDVNEGVYSHTTWEVSGVVQWAGIWTFRLGRGGSRAVDAGTAAGDVSEGFTLAGIELDRRNSVLVPTAGYRLGLTSRRGIKRYTPAGDSLRVRIDRTRWDVEGDGYRRVGRRWLAAVTANFRYLETPEDSLPRYDLFAVGGAASLRGYREEQFLTPGAFILQVEWRWLQDDRGSALYLFDDLGFISPREGRSLRDTFHTFLMGTGVGVRQASKLGILGVEYGVAKGENPLDGRIHLRVDAVF